MRTRHGESAAPRARERLHRLREGFNAGPEAQLILRSCSQGGGGRAVKALPYGKGFKLLKRLEK